MNLKHKVLRGGFWVASAKGLGQLFSWGLTIILARLLSPSEFGLVAMGLVFLHFAESFYELGIGVYLIQKKVLDENELSTFFWMSAFSGLLLFGMTILCSPLIAAFFRAAELERILGVLGINFVIISVGVVPLSLLTKGLEFKKRSAAEFFSDLASGVVAVVLAYGGFGVWSLVLRSLTRGLIFSLLLFVIQEWRPRFMFSLRKSTDALRFSMPIIGSRLLWFFHSHSDYLVIGRFLGDHILGLYRVAFLLSRKPLDKVWMVAGELSLPVFSKVQGEKEKLRTAYLKFIRYVSLIVFPANLGLILAADDAITALLGDRWLASVIPLKLLCILGIFKSIDMGVAPLLNALGRPQLNFKFDLISCILMPLGFLVGVQFGVVGVCIAWIVVYPAMGLVKTITAARMLKVRAKSFIESYYEALSGAAFMALVVVLFSHTLIAWWSSFERLIAISIIGGTAYSAFLLMISGQFRKELKEVLVMLAKKA
jgi:O-antigen/teichoic acid export membrane protein